MKSTLAIATVLVSSTVLIPSLKACSACGCSLSTDTGLHAAPDSSPWTLATRLEYYDQDQLRSGSDVIDRSSLEIPNEEEIQKETRNRNLWLSLSHTFRSHWDISAEIPWNDRFHTTYAEGDDALSTSEIRGLGDLRVRGGWSGETGALRYHATAGLKLPTGKSDQTFSEGPEAGELLDRGLQLGTGTTDLLANASLSGPLGSSAGWFSDLGYSAPLTENKGFKPSPNFAANIGIRYSMTPSIVPSLQLNYRWEGREAGENSDRDNSGGTFFYLAPGVTIHAGAATELFTFLQLPLAQHVNGLQLQPHWLLSAGARWSF